MHEPGRAFIVPTPYQAALNDFQRARAQASLQEIVARLQGKSIALLPYEEVAQKLKVTGRSEVGRRPIPLEAIVGSVGRYADFTRTFLPRLDADRVRWASVKAAAADVSELPPIQAYQIGDAYFVLDGNHRVSVARQQGLAHIDAQIVRVRTRVPFSFDDDPETLIVKGEYANFLAETEFDLLKPEAFLLVSAAGQYVRLQDQIEVHRYFIEEAEGQEVSDQEAVVRWYEEAYVPIVEAIREQGILRYFPQRTETDLYVWIARHQALLRNELGWQVRPGRATAHLARSVDQAASGRLALLRGRLRAALPGGSPRLSDRRWSQERVLARYSGHLFADVLLPLAPEAEEAALQQAIWLAQKESGRIYGLQMVDDERPDEGTQEQVVETFYRRCAAADVEGYLTRQSDHSRQAICRRALLADVLLIGSDYAGSGKGTFEETALYLLHSCSRPVWIVGREWAPVRRVLLIYDGGPRAQDALFAATYMAEAWQVGLIVGVARRHFWQRIRSYVGKYLALHEVGARFVDLKGSLPNAISTLAEAHGCDLIVMPGIDRSGLWPGKSRQTLEQLLERTTRSVLVCT